MGRDIAALVASMTVEEKARFTAGADFWTLVANERVGIPPIRVTDGPNGARGSALFARSEGRLLLDRHRSHQRGDVSSHARERNSPLPTQVASLRVVRR